MCVYNTYIWTGRYVMENNENLPETSKKKLRRMAPIVPKGLKNPFVIFITSVVVFCLAWFTLFCLDGENVLRPAWLKDNFIYQIFKAIFQGTPFNIRISTWFWFFFIFGTAFVILFICLTRKKMKAIFDAKSMKKWNHPMINGQKKLFYTLFYGLPILLLGAGVATVLCVFPRYWLKFTDIGGDFVNLLLTLVILLVVFAAIPLALFILYLLIRLILLIISLFISGITRNVMRSSSFQENKAIAQAATDDIRDILATYKGSKPVTGTGIISDNLFPGCNEIDAHYDGIIKARENAQKQYELDVAYAKKYKHPLPEAPHYEEVNYVDREFTYKEISNFCYEFQSYLCHNHFYFDIDTLRTFVAALASSRLVLLQGVSGTGKSTLPRVFMNFIGGQAHFFPVQATWRDRSDVTGYMDIFSGQYNETEILKCLYKSNYNPNVINMMVLDEMNISRVEYYFADFLSTLEYPEEEWKIQLIQPDKDLKLPHKFEDGAIRIMNNTWFVGTINVDESTYGVSDKVYDRATVINFKQINKPFMVDYPYEHKNLTCKELANMLNKCLNTKDYQLKDKEREEFDQLCIFACDALNIEYGNRILNQILNFVPAFVGLGGKKNTALDIMFANKILRKVEGRFDNYIKEGLNKLSRYIIVNYGKDEFKYSLKTIARLVKRLG